MCSILFKGHWTSQNYDDRGRLKKEKDMKVIGGEEERKIIELKETESMED